MRIRLLGPLEVEGDDGQRLALGGRQAQALLALLAVEANRLVPVSRLIDELWGEEPPTSARKTVQTYVFRLRKVLGSERLLSSSDGYRLVAADDEIDAQEFARLVAAGSLEQALALWRGPPLSGLEFVPALAGEAQRLEQLRAEAVERSVDVGLAAGEHAHLIPQLEALVREQPLREAVRARLMLALYRTAAKPTRSRSTARAEPCWPRNSAWNPRQSCASCNEQCLPRIRRSTSQRDAMFVRSRPERSRSSRPTWRGRLASSASCATSIPPCWPITAESCARHSHGTVARRWTPSATGSSTSSRAPATRLQQQQTHSARCTHTPGQKAAKCESASGCTPAT